MTQRALVCCFKDEKGRRKMRFRKNFSYSRFLFSFADFGFSIADFDSPF